MNVNNVLRSIRQSRKLLPISVYGSDIKPCIPADREFFNVINPALKLILKAFKTSGFTAYVSKWGELGMYSASLGIEILVQVSSNLSYMSKANTESIKNKGYEVLEIEVQRNPFVLSYFFLGTASKWRHISFDTELTSVESIYLNLIEPILKVSKPFYGRLKDSLLKQKDEAIISHDTLSAFAHYASYHVDKAFGLAMYRKLTDEKYIYKCFANNYGAVLLTHSWPSVFVVNWSKKDLKFFEKYLPELLFPLELQCPSLNDIQPESPEHALLLYSLDNALLTTQETVTCAEIWLAQSYHSLKRTSRKELLSTPSEIEKALCQLNI